MAKYCTQCGNELKDGDNFCRECGKSVSSDAFSNNNVVVAPPKNTAATLAVIGFILSFFGFELVISIISTVLCVISINRSDGSKESLKGLAIAGIVINVLKLIFILLIIIVVAVGFSSDFTSLGRLFVK